MSDVSGFLIPAGFQFAATTAGLKASGRPDFAVIVAGGPSGIAANAAAMFTANCISAAPLAVDKAHLQATGGRVRVVAINAGNANCAVGQAGLDAAFATCRSAGEYFDCLPEEVFPSSTGVIGVPLPVEKLVAAMPAVRAGLGTKLEDFQAVASAIMTTDLVEKTAFARFMHEGREVRVAGVGKGSGMIHPRLQSEPPHATMLMYLLTDAEVDSALLQQMLERAVERSFNRISVDGDTSTNDTVLLLSSGASQVRVESADSEPCRELEVALTQVATSLARQVVADGEGVSHVVELRIQGAATDADALTVAKAIAHSPLVKTAWAGSDPNWGRLMAAIGNSGAELEPARIDIWFGDLRICRDGARAAEMDVAAAHSYLQQAEFTVTIDLNGAGVGGNGSCTFWTADLTHGYISINADYST